MNWSEQNTAVSVTVGNLCELLADLQLRLSDRRGFSVATLNLDHAVKMRDNKTFAAAYCAHSHVTADGRPVVWLSHLAGQNEVRLVPGSELIAPVATLASSEGVSVGLLGTTDGALRKARVELQTRNKKLEVALTLAPPMGFDPDGAEAAKAIEAIEESGVRIVFLALGAPKQECFAARAQLALPEVGFISIGAGLDFIAGRQKRAPKIVRLFAAEWLWRLLCDPARLSKRYLACFAILPRLTLRALATRRVRRGAA